ncbi:F-box/LRR-repeat protein 25-like protein [Tanacetum coccineum]
MLHLLKLFSGLNFVHHFVNPTELPRVRFVYSHYSEDCRLLLREGSTVPEFVDVPLQSFPKMFPKYSDTCVTGFGGVEVLVVSSPVGKVAMEMVEEVQNQPDEITPKRNEIGDEEEDRISPMLDCLILKIISHLPTTKEAVRTGTLSKRWEHLWPFVPNLIFYNPDIDESHSPSDFF